MLLSTPLICFWAQDSAFEYFNKALQVLYSVAKIPTCKACKRFLMRYRRLECLEQNVSEICFGTWQIGGAKFGNVDPKGAVDLLNESYDRGVNIFETSNVYGNGRSEVLLGLAFSGRKRSEVILVSKAGYLTGIDGCQELLKTFPQSFKENELENSLDNSLKRLKTDYLDIFLLHDPPTKTLQDEKIFYWMEKMKNDGKIRSYGLSTSPNKCRFAFEKNLKVVEVIYNFYNAKAGNFIESATAKGIDILPRSPFHNGEVFRNNQLRNFLNNKDSSKSTEIAHECLDFVLANANIKSVVTGMISSYELSENLKYWEYI